MEQIPLEDLALLEVLQRIDQRVELSGIDSEMSQRLIEGGLASGSEEGLQLTAAGVELCKSLQHRVAADNLKAAAEAAQG
ncbi:MAG TPA: hypothetical protein VFI26_05310 [Lysobacter sp.]|nr:hypothetical protein [Lysobacter sp.]